MTRSISTINDSRFQTPADTESNRRSILEEYEGEKVNERQWSLKVEMKRHIKEEKEMMEKNEKR